MPAPPQIPLTSEEGSHHGARTHILRLIAILFFLWIVRLSADLSDVSGFLPHSTRPYLLAFTEISVAILVAYHVYLCFPIVQARSLLSGMALGCALLVLRSATRILPDTWVPPNIGHREFLQLSDALFGNGGTLILAGSICALLLLQWDTIMRVMRNERRLQESEERFRQFFEFAPDPCFISDLNGVFIDGNRASELLVGYAREELRGRSFLEADFLYPESMQRVSEVMSDNVNGLDTGPNDFRIRTRDGASVIIEVRAHPITLAGEQVVLSIARDITQRKQTEILQSVHVYLLDCLTTGRPLQEIMDGVTHEIERKIPGIRCSILLLHDDGHRLRLGSAPSLPDFYNDAIDGLEIGDGVGACGTTAYTGTRTVTADIATHPYWDRFRDIAARANIASCWSEPILSREGKVLGTFAVYRDVAGAPGDSDLTLIATAAHFMSIAIERTRAEDALRTSEALYHSLVENLPQSILRKDLNGRFTFANRGLCNNIGQSWEEIAGKTDADFYPPALAEKYRLDDLRVIQTGKPIALVEEHIAPDGSKLFVEVVKTPLCDAHGRVIGVQGIFWDVSERMRADEKLRASEDRFVQFMKNLPGIAFIKDHDLRFVYANPQFETALGFQRDDWFEKTNEELFPPDVAASLTEFDNTVLKSNAPQQVEEEIAGRWLLTSKFPVASKDSRHLLGGIAIDITDRKNAERERQEMERRMQHVQKLESLGVLAGGIAHDFNNLLLVMLGHADLALAELPQMSPARGNIAEMERAARRAADLCRQMLAYSGKGKFVIESVSLSELVSEMVHLLKASISKKVTLSLHLQENLPAIDGDPAQMQQILMNLITNASEAIGEQPGVLTVATGAMHCSRAYLDEIMLDKDLPEGEYVYLEVSDTGCGMDSETTKRVFEPFFTTKFTGRGLGMAAVLGIVRGHKGAIRLYSEPGHGTTFRVLFPASRKAAPPAARTDVSSDSGWKGSGFVLLVDDEATILALGGHMLERMGFSVLTANDGQEALEVFREHQDGISLVLLDLTMPKMDGEETFRELRRLDPKVRVVMTSGYTEYDVATRFVGQGLSGFIQKPYTSASLQACLQKTFANSHSKTT